MFQFPLSLTHSLVAYAAAHLMTIMMMNVLSERMLKEGYLSLSGVAIKIDLFSCLKFRNKPCRG
jgi:hypothetical protein